MPKKAKLIPRNKIQLVEIVQIMDKDPDTSYLQQNDESGEPLFAERWQQFQDGQFDFIGIYAEAHIITPDGFGYTEQIVHSGGLWGIESDSDASYIESEEKNQLDELSGVLLGFGFSRRAIATAFKNVQRKDV